MQIQLNVETNGTFSDFLKQYPQQNKSASLVPFFRGVNAGSQNANITALGGAVASSGDVTFNTFVENDTVTLNGVVFTGKDEPAGDNEFAIGGDDEETRNNFYTKILNSELAKIYKIVTPKSKLTVTLLNVEEDDTIVISGVTFTAKITPTTARQFALGAGDKDATTNLIKVLKTYFDELYLGEKDKYSITSTGDTSFYLLIKSVLVVTGSGTFTISDATCVLECNIPGLISNLCSLAISAHGTVNDFTGGDNGTEVNYSSNL